MFESGLDNELMTLDTGFENSAMAAEQSDLGLQDEPADNGFKGNPYQGYQVGSDGNWYQWGTEGERVYYWVPPAETDSTIASGGETQGIGQDRGGYYTEAEIRAAWNAKEGMGYLKKQVSWDQYWGFIQERQALMQSGDLPDPTTREYMADYPADEVEKTFTGTNIGSSFGNGREEEKYYAQLDAAGQEASLRAMENWVQLNANLMNKYGIPGVYQNGDGDYFAFNGSTYSRVYKQEGTDWGRIVAGVMIGAFTGMVGGAIGSAIAPYAASMPGMAGYLGGKLAGAIGATTGGAAGYESVAGGAFNPNVIVNLTEGINGSEQGSNSSDNNAGSDKTNSPFSAVNPPSIISAVGDYFNPDSDGEAVDDMWWYRKLWDIFRPESYTDDTDRLERQDAVNRWINAVNQYQAGNITEEELRAVDTDALSDIDGWAEYVEAVIAGEPPDGTTTQTPGQSSSPDPTGVYGAYNLPDGYVYDDDKQAVINTETGEEYPVTYTLYGNKDGGSPYNWVVELPVPEGESGGAGSSSASSSDSGGSTTTTSSSSSNTGAGGENPGGTYEGTVLTNGTYGDIRIDDRPEIWEEGNEYAGWILVSNTGVWGESGISVIYNPGTGFYQEIDWDNGTYDQRMEDTDQENPNPFDTSGTGGDSAGTNGTGTTTTPATPTPAEGDPCTLDKGGEGVIKNGVCVPKKTGLDITGIDPWGDPNSTTNPNPSPDPSPDGDGDSNSGSSGDGNTTTTTNSTPGPSGNTGAGIDVTGIDPWGGQGIGGGTGTGNGPDGSGSGDGGGDGDGNGGDGDGPGAGGLLSGGKGVFDPTWTKLPQGHVFQPYKPDQRKVRGLKYKPKTKLVREEIYADLWRNLS